MLYAIDTKFRKTITLFIPLNYIFLLLYIHQPQQQPYDRTNRHNIH